MSANKQTRKTAQRSHFQRLIRRFMSGLLRSLFFINLSPRRSRAGFVLPTTVLLILIVTLTLGALSFRTASRTESTRLNREQQIVENAASPAADRAKAKLEYLFSRDVRFPGNNTPSSDVLGVLLRGDVDSLGANGVGIAGLGTDPYTLPDETRIDINGGGVDNAWSFPFDVNADGNIGTEEVIVYSILMDDTADPNNTPGNANDDVTTSDSGSSALALKANNLVTRNGPINTSNIGANCGSNRAPAQGWQTVNQGILEKNFQITAYASNGSNLARANSALELQQVRISQLGNTWGAWFKYDMELHPGPNFNWNGAIHTDGNLFITNNFQGHMISSHNSCLYTQNAAAITMDSVDNDDDNIIDVTQSDSVDFQGQLIAGAPAYNNLNVRGRPRVHLFNGLGTRPITGGDDTQIVRERDSVAGTSYNDMLEIALDPLFLFTRNEQRHRQTGTWTRDGNWDARPMVTNGRITNQSQNPPFLDDFFRADNRYGPKPEYAGLNWVKRTEDGANVTDRDDPNYDIQLGDEIIATDNLSDTLTNATSGLDGYWERQAIQDGMRIIIGQRLELGNPAGWNNDANGGTTDPLYPPNANINNKQRQRVTLRDNLAAVQGMVVYHYQTADGQYPLACIANTSHPGTLETLRNSRTFTINTAGPNNGEPAIDFFRGVGTNGWEFDFPDAFDTEAEFADALAVGQPLGNALRNLAGFAGDPRGGSPSFTPDQTDGFVHPFPHQAMWGNYSILRRIFDDLLDNTAWRSTANPPQVTGIDNRYDELSPADKSALHSATCTLGMLAYNVDSALAEQANALSASTTLNDVGVDTFNRVNTEETPGTDWTALYQSYSTADWINQYRISVGATPFAPAINELRESVETVQFGNQIHRDRMLGFNPGNAVALAALTGGNNNYAWDPATGETVVSLPDPSDSTLTQNVTFRTSCDPDIFNQVVTDTGADGDRAHMGLAMMMCSADANPVRYPSLYYLFPIVDHDHDGAPATGEVTVSPVFDIDHTQPGTEEYIDRVGNGLNGYGQNAGFIYTVLEDTDGNDIEDGAENGYADIAFSPRANDGSDWVLPVRTPTLGNLDPGSMDIKVINGANDVNVGLSILDKVFYNGREEMTVRTLDIDLEQLTRNRNGGAGNDYWISDDRESTSGILYAAREDAAREDSITRPVPNVGGADTVWTQCDELNELVSQNRCWMNPNAPADPPLSRREDDNNSFVGISVKPIDYAPDPDRRPYGFRLNADLNGNDGDLSNRTNRTWGLTFVTDNLAYLKGTFNPHTITGADDDTIEEFTETLFDGSVGFGNPFYNRRFTVDNQFATTANDRWRVAEILADAVYLLSDNYVDGAVQEGFIRNRGQNSTDFQNTAGNNSRTSFHNQQRPLRENNNAWANAANWLRVDGAFGDDTIPIWVGRNGESADNNRIYDNAESDDRFMVVNERNNNSLNPAATPERMNATIISGLVPSRGRQGYGGLHNFPRFLEHWGGNNLFIQGAFLQLNFSTSGTGPFDLDAWEPGDGVENAERIGYYSPPSRRWGYDVGLQFTPAGPIAQRFVTVGNPRSEHYRDLPIDDPYVTNLRCAVQDPDEDGTFDRIFPDEICP
ncbi:MAG: hormogonium polysaccharide biosynthesis protein HpsA [Cyanobacteria bacterium J06621_11]